MSQQAVEKGYICTVLTLNFSSGSSLPIDLPQLKSTWTSLVNFVYMGIALNVQLNDVRKTQST